MGVVWNSFGWGGVGKSIGQQKGGIPLTIMAPAGRSPEYTGPSPEKGRGNNQKEGGLPLGPKQSLTLWSRGRGQSRSTKCYFLFAEERGAEAVKGCLRLLGATRFHKRGATGEGKDVLQKGHQGLERDRLGFVKKNGAWGVGGGSHQRKVERI